MKVAIVQSSSTPNLNDNLTFVKEQLSQAKAASAQMIIFPECILCWAKPEVTRTKAKSLKEWQAILGALSQEFQIHSVWGGIQVLEEDKIYNTSLVFDEGGKTIAKYEKTHLFQLFIKDKISVDETQTYEFGRSGPVSFEVNGYSFGLSICYDLRFPEFYRTYAGVDALICTAAFTKKTGRAHWEPLLRARAIENQCYMLAAGQSGINKLNGIQTWGHSMIIDSWGKIIVNAEKEIGTIIAEISKEKIASDRELLPALKNKRL